MNLEQKINNFNLFFPSKKDIFNNFKVNYEGRKIMKYKVKVKKYKSNNNNNRSNRQRRKLIEYYLLKLLKY